MIVRTQSPDSRRPAIAVARPTLRRRSMCQFIALALFGGVAHAATPPAFSPAWFANKQANAATQAPPPGQGAGNAGGNVFTPGNVMLQQRVQQSIANLDAAAQAVAAQMAAQKGAQSAAQQLISNVPNGLGDGGLKVDRNVGTDPSLWQNANQPTQTVANGRTNVEIKQTAGKAIMTWESFNVGNQTTVHFDQTGGNQTGGGNQWIALNRINDPSGKPSQILGQIKAEGTVYLLNRNGMIFGGGAQVDTHSLIASSLDLFSTDVKKSNAFFLKYGIGTNTDSENILGNGAGAGISGFLVSGLLTGVAGDARGAVTIQKGASINATKDGFVIVAAQDVSNAGSIVADDGQVAIAATPGLIMGNGGVSDLQASGFNQPTNGPGWNVTNTGLVQARRGSIHLFGDHMTQGGVLVASTSLSHPGRIAFDPLHGGDNKLVFDTSSVTTVLPEKDGETTTSSAAANAAFVTSRVDVGLNAVLRKGSLIEVPSGNVTFGFPTYVDTGATVDVSGLANVTLPVSSLLVTIPRIGQNELADSPLLRNSFLFTQKNVAVDSSQSGTRADGLNWVGSPVLNAAGYVSNIPRTVDQLMINSGNIAFQDSAVIRSGAQIRLDGGFINYLPGYIQTPRLQGANGLIYNLASADPQVSYTGFAGVYSSDHARWGITETYVTSPLLANMGRWDPGFINGGNAGTLSFGKSTDNGQAYRYVIDGDITAHAYAGREQVRSGSLPLAGILDIRSRDLASLGESVNVSLAGSVNYVIQNDPVPLQTYAPDFDENSTFPARGGDPSDPSNPLYWRTLSTAMIDNAGFRRLKLSTPGTVLIKDGATLHLADGGSVDIAGTSIDVQGDIVTHGGSITLGVRGQSDNLPTNVATSLVIGEHGRLDASGLWVNDSGRAADAAQGRAFINGGSVTLSAWKGGRSTAGDLTPDISVLKGSVIDVSGGGYVGTDGKLAMDGNLPLGRGGDVTIQSHTDDGLNTFKNVTRPNDLAGGKITLDGTLLADGFSGGGTLTLHAPYIQIGGEAIDDDSVAALYLTPEFFEGQGFSRYSLIADTNVVTAPGVRLQVRPSYMVGDRTALLTLGSRTSLFGDSGAAMIHAGSVAAYDRYRHLRQGDGISMQAGLYQGWNAGTQTPSYDALTGSVIVGDGASIEVGAGETIALNSAGRIVVRGALTARGGSILLHDIGVAINTDPVGRQIWLGSNSLLDARGATLLNPSAGALPGTGTTIRRDGVLLGGGTVELQSDASLVAERGATVLFSGASDHFDLPAEGRQAGLSSTPFVDTPVWSDGGSLSLQAAKTLQFDGTIDGHGGGPSARGGRFSVATRFPAKGNAGTVTTLFIQQSGWLAQPVDPLASVEPGQGLTGNLRFAVDRLQGAGLDDVLIGKTFSDDDPSVPTTNVAFAGDVNLATGRSIQISAATVAAVAPDARALPSNGATGVGGGRVTISAPYVSFSNPRIADSILTASGSGSLAVNADFIDIGGRLSLAGMANTAFTSTGDIRFSLPANSAYSASGPATGWLYTTGDLDFTGSRVYPATDYRFLIDATNPARKTTVSFHQAAVRDASTPLSAGGVLAVGADTIEQRGTVWVPSGALALGTDNPAATLAALGLASSMPLGITSAVHLAPGSVTSVSLDNAIVPYGTTVDGKDWRYDASSVLPGRIVTAPPEKTLSIAGGTVAVDAGANVDLSGGGHVQAVEWVPGTGGSRDVLSQYNLSYANSTQGQQVPLYADGRAIYAIVPGYDAPLAAHDAALEKGAGAGPAVGQGVYLSGVPGLPDGVYTLLPARYATLPGAYRVVQDTSSSNAVLGRSTTMPDGTVVASGYFADTLTGAHDAQASNFLVQSAKVWGQYSEYSITSADTFFTDAAARSGSVVPQLGADAGRLTLAASAALTLGATLNAQPGTGGRGSQVDIAGEAIQILGGSGQARDGYLHVDADGLSRLGAGSLLIGGKRSREGGGDRVDVLADNVLLSNDAAHPLQGSEVILVANGQGGVTLDAGSSLLATGATNGSTTPLLIGRVADKTGSAVAGDGSLLRVSGGDVGRILRANITGLDGVAGLAGGSLVIGSGASIGSTGSISMDATGATTLADDARLKASSIDVTANRIALSGVDASAADASGRLLVGPRILAQLAGLDATVLRGRSGIDLFGDVNLGVAHALTLSAPQIVSDGGKTTLKADILTLSNDTGNTSAPVQAGHGSLGIDVREWHTGNGNLSLGGLDTVNLRASAGMYASGVGTLDLGAAALNATTPVVVVDHGANAHWQGTGAILVAAAGTGAGISTTASAGQLGIKGASIDLGSNLLAKGGTVNLDATTGGIVIEDGATLDVSGLSQAFNDTSVHVSGGSLSLRAEQGNIHIAPTAVIDIRGDVAGGNGGSLDLRADAGSVDLAGNIAGSVATGYFGSLFSLDSLGAVDLGSLTDKLASGSVDGRVKVHTQQGDLAVDAGHTLRAHLVTLTADGGAVNVGGTVDASGTFGGTIALSGARGVDIDGTLDTSASAKGRYGGDITLATSGTSNGTLNTQYGYEEVTADNAGHIRIGQGARIEQGGDTANGNLYLRAPLLANGDTPVDIASSASMAHTRNRTLEVYAIWDTQDAKTDPSKHFDGLVDPAGWFRMDDATGRPVLVAGTFTDSNGNAVAGPDPTDMVKVTDFLARYTFTPDSANTDHQSFYGFLNGDSSQGPGALMGFVQSPGFTFESRLGGVAGLAVRPGIELRNGDPNVDKGAISVVTPWNLGAGTRNADGSLQLDYRYKGQAPVLSLLASGDLNVRASVSDGFFQDGNAGGSAGTPPPPASYNAAVAAWQELFDLGLGVEQYPDLFEQPTQLTSDPTQLFDYYGQYVAYAKYLAAPIPDLAGYQAAQVILYGLGYQMTVPVPNAPPPPAPPTTLTSYLAYMAAYPAYLKDSAIKSGFTDSLSVPEGFQKLYAPLATTTPIDTSAPVDNSPSPVALPSNPLPFLSAGLTGGSSSSYRFVAGADLSSSDPLAMSAATLANVHLAGHTEFNDTAGGRVLAAPTVVRTGTGDIDIVASGDLTWDDQKAPAAVYTAGEPAPGTQVGSAVSILQPSLAGGLDQQATPELVLSGGVNPINAGHVGLSAGRDILGKQDITDVDGTLTGSVGTPLAQYWWQWLQTTNTEARSSINFGAFDQGVMSAGGNVAVSAGGDIRQLSVSLPTTWSIDTAADGTRSLTTYGGGDLDVRAGGDILSGSYFVSRGQGTIRAGGSIGSDFSTTYRMPDRSQATGPVSTLLGMQDSRLDVQAGGSVSLGGIFNPSWLDSSAVNALIPAGHADGQSYSQSSRIDVTALGGNIVYGDLAAPVQLFVPGIRSIQDAGSDTAGDVLPATVNFAAVSGSIDLEGSGELFPSSNGNLSLLAKDSITFDMPAIGLGWRYGWGLIDAPLSSMVSPLNLPPLTDQSATIINHLRQYGYLDIGNFPTVGTSNFVHASTPWHADDTQPVRIYAQTGDIVNGTGGGVGGVYLVTSKATKIKAGRDIVDLAYVGQQLRGADISSIEAGRDIYDTPLTTVAATQLSPRAVFPTLLQGGPGYFYVTAGRDIGRLASQTEYYALLPYVQTQYMIASQPGSSAFMTGIDTIGNLYNPYLSPTGASISIAYGIAPGMDSKAFVSAYIDPSTSKPPGLDDGAKSLVDFVQSYDAGLQVDTGLVANASTPVYTTEQAWTRFQQLPEEARNIFIQKTLSRVLAQVGKDYNDAASPFAGKYARGFAAINALFPASLGYTANGLEGGLNGAGTTVHTGDLDIRGSTIQTQRGGDVSIVAPGGQALLGSVSAPPVIVSSAGVVLAGPNTQGVLTLQQGDITFVTDRSTLLAQSRIFTEQGGDIVMWSSNGDINAGKGAKTNSEIPPVRYLCTVDAWCAQDPSGQVAGAGIATLQTVPGAPEGSVYLMAPRGTVDAGDAGIRVSGNLVVAAARVANADNVQVKGESVGLPVVQSVNVGALNAAGAAANAASKAAGDVVRQQQSDSRDRMPSIISVQVIGGNSGASVSPSKAAGAYDSDSAVQVVRRAGYGDGLTDAERSRLR